MRIENHVPSLPTSQVSPRDRWLTGCASCPRGRMNVNVNQDPSRHSGVIFCMIILRIILNLMSDVRRLRSHGGTGARGRHGAAAAHRARSHTDIAVIHAAAHSHGRSTVTVVEVYPPSAVAVPPAGGSSRRSRQPDTSPLAGEPGTTQTRVCAQSHIR